MGAKGRGRGRRWSGLVLAGLLLAAPAGAVLIDSGDGSGNTQAPAPDPGFGNVGLRGSLTAIYLGDSYILTAHHVGMGDVDLDGATYRAVPGTGVRLQNPTGGEADLELFCIHPVPPLPPLSIADESPGVGEALILVGNGYDRDVPTSYDPNGPLPPAPIEGYLWGAARSLRWGTNEVDSYLTLTLAGSTTETIMTSFDAAATAHEAAAATGDSGGAVFHHDGTRWELAGVMLAISQFAGQDPASSLYGNATYSADLAVYRDQILDVMALPEPAGGLLAGAAALLALERRRRRR